VSEPIIKRDERGRLLPGFANINPGGRPRSEIERVRELLSPNVPEMVETLVALTRSKDEKTKLAAIEIFFDRLLGKAPVSADVTTTKLDIGALYLEAAKAVNASYAPTDAIDVTPASNDTVPNEEW
jgi:hypothetical protein